MSARLPAEGVLRVGRLRSDSQDADVDRRNAVLPIRQHGSRLQGQQLRLRLTPARAPCYARRHQYGCGRSAAEVYRLQEPRQPELEGHRRSLLYYTWSQGYRPGGFNRAPGTSANVPDQNGVGQYFTPAGYAPDTVDQQRDRLEDAMVRSPPRVQRRGLQGRLEKCAAGVLRSASDLGNLTFNTNGPNYRVKGVETQLVARVTRGLTILGSVVVEQHRANQFAVLDCEQSDQCEVRQADYHDCKSLRGQGSPLAQSPPFQGNLRARYEWSIDEYQAFVQLGAAHQAHSLSLTGNAPSIAPTGSITQAFDQPAFTTYDGALGVSKDAWNVQVYGQNLTDTRGLTFISSSQAVETQSVIRPRVVGVKFGYKF